MKTRQQINDDDVIYEDADQFRGATASSIKEIVLRQFSKCCTELSKEMTRGGAFTRYVDGKYIEIVAPDQIQIVINSIETLRIILQPKIKEKEDLMTPLIAEFNKAIEDLKNTRNEQLNTILAQDSEDNYYLTLEQKNELRSNTTELIREYDRNYDGGLLSAYKKLFVVLSSLMAEYNYFDEVGAVGNL